MKKILFATDNRFWLTNQGSKCRIAALLKHLTGSGFEVHLYFVGFMRSATRRKIRETFGIERIYPNPLSPAYLVFEIFRIVRWLTRRRFGEPTLGHFRSPRQRNHFQTVLQTVEPDIIIIQYIHLAYLLENLPVLPGKEARVTVIDTHDLMFRRRDVFHRHGQKHWIAITRQEEKNAPCRQATHCSLHVFSPWRALKEVTAAQIPSASSCMVESRGE